MRCWARNTALVGELTDQEDSRLKSQNNHLVRVWIPGSFMDQRWGMGGEKKLRRPLILQVSPRMASLRQEGVLISSFPPSTGRQGYDKGTLA